MSRSLYRLLYLLGEGLRALRTHAALALMTGATIALTLLLAAGFATLYERLARAAEGVQQRLGVVVFLEDGCAPEQRQALRDWLAARPEVARVAFTSKAEAAAAFRERHPESARLLDLLEENPLPASLEVHLAAGTTPGAVAALARELEGFDGVESVRYGERWLAQLLGLGRGVRLAGLAAGGLLAVAAILIVSNQVAMSIYARREEIDVMRLLGATNRFIRAPFYLEGALTGAAGGLAAAALLALLRAALARLAPAAGPLAHLAAPAPGPGVAALAAAGALLGLLGCWASLGRFLKG
ncbi:MAG: FtsX-like permease family protein [Nitrospirae bacterium]|nr:MAG: FtsX-like permease family protein [Nitrospirota bacterium]